MTNAVEKLGMHHHHPRMLEGRLVGVSVVLVVADLVERQVEIRRLEAGRPRP